MYVNLRYFNSFIGFFYFFVFFIKKIYFFLIFRVMCLGFYIKILILNDIIMIIKFRFILKL